MATSIGSLVVDLVANTARFRNDLQQASKATNTAVAQMTGAFKGLQQAIATIAGGAGLGLLINRSLAFADEIAKMSQRVGIGIESLQRLQHAARLSGVETEQFQQALIILNRRLGEAAAGEKEAADGFRRAGIAITDSGGRIRATESVLRDFADKLQKTEGAAERTRLATEAFGRGGAQLLPLLAQGTKALDAFGDEAERLGLVMSAELVKKAEHTKDQLETLSAVVQVTLVNALGNAMPVIKEFANLLTKATSGWAHLIDVFSTDSAASIQEIASRIADLNRKIADLEADQKTPRLLDSILGTRDYTWHIEGLKKTREELRKLLRDKMQVSREDAVPQAGFGAGGPAATAGVAGYGGMLSISERLREMALDAHRLNEALRETERLAQFPASVGPDPFGGFERAADAVTRINEELQNTLDLAHLVNESDPFAGFEAGMKAHEERTRAVDEYIKSLKNEVAITGLSAREQERYAALAKLGAAATTEQAAAINDLIDRKHNLIEWSQKVADAAKAEAEATKTFTEDLKNAAMHGVNSFADALANLATTGKASFADMAKAIITDINRMIVRMLIFRAIEAGAGAIGNWWSGLGTTTGGSPGYGNVTSMATGGIVKARPGGQLIIAGEGGQDEAIIPLSKLPMVGGGGATVEIHVHNHSGEPVRRQSRRGGDGRVIEEIIIGTVDKALGAGRFDRGMGQNYGVTRRGTSR